MFGPKGKYRKARSSIVKILSVSRAPSGFTAIEDDRGETNKRALGYVYGCTDSALQVRELTIEGELGLSTLVEVFEALWPGKGVSYSKLSLKYLVDEEDPEFMRGVMSGGQEYVEFVRDKKAPFGLSKALLHMDKE